jgi:excinuclease UvrABC ATPase subunit
MHDVLLPSVAAVCDRRKNKYDAHRAPLQQMSGAEGIEAVYELDQSPIGKTSRVLYRRK